MLSRFILFVYVAKKNPGSIITHSVSLHAIKVIPSTSVKHVKCFHVQTKVDTHWFPHSDDTEELHHIGVSELPIDGGLLQKLDSVFL